MTPNQQMEELSFTYVRGIAARAGFKVARPIPDTDSVDGFLMSDYGRRPRVDFQAKSTTRDLLHTDNIHFPLPVKNYNELRADTLVPRILVVLLMPADAAEWLVQSAEELCLRHCAYWLSLEGRPAMPNSDSVTVRVPVANVFSVEQLTGLMGKVEKGESLC